jgi:hypothetical protein
MHSGDLARERIQDMVRQAEAFRRSRDTRAARAAERHGTVRRVATAAVSALLWPVKH